jgi:multidrug resistance efflux pump
VFPLIAFLCYHLGHKIIFNRNQQFYGYTDNKETELSLNLSSFVEKVYAKPGMSVKKGDTLFILSKSSIDRDIKILDSEIAMHIEKKKYNEAEIFASISKINAETQNKINEIQSDINIEKAKLEYAKNSIVGVDTKNEINLENHPSQIKINKLYDEISSLKKQTSEIIANYQDLLHANRNQNASIQKLLIDKNYLIDSKNKLYVLAPFDGLVGNINCKENEYKSANATLLSFYELNPASVIGFVHESMILDVKIGDTATIESLLQPQLDPIKGIVTGIGHRIIEIPERLQKIPELKSYGIEVYISIPPNNRLLQKELVKINTNKLNPKD